MNFDIIPTPDFERALKALAKKHRSLKNDLLEFSKSLQMNPFQGVELCPGIRKIRMAITSKGKGKSGGARVITYTGIYDKSDFSTVDISIIKEIVRSLE